MLPLSDLNPRRRFPFLTYGLIVANVLAFVWELNIPPEQLENTLKDLSVVPASASAHPFSTETILDVLRSMFFHGGFTHLIGNMLYLFLFGDNVEDRLGSILFLLLYFGSGFAAVAAQVLVDPSSTIVMVGASGAIAGVLGSYFIFFPGVRVRGIVPLGFAGFLSEWPAWLVIGLWFVMQLFTGVASLSVRTEGGGVAFFAHIGGFVFGLILTLIVMGFLRQPPAAERQEMLYRRAQ